MELEAALEHALSGDSILFVGAGFSLGALNSRAQPLKTGPRFAEHLCTLAGLPHDMQLDEASEEFVRSRGRDALLGELKAEFTVSQVEAYHRIVVGLPWRRIYTTNYDTVVERAAVENGKSPHAVTLSTDIREIPKNELIVVHLNGYVDRATRANVTSEIKLTDTSYVTSAVSDSPWAIQFRQDLAVASAVFFVGYSLADLDLRRILFDDAELRSKAFFFVGPNPDAISARRAARFGKAFHESTAQLSERIDATRARYTPREATLPLLHAFKEYRPRTTSTPPADRDMYNLFLFGDIREPLVRLSLQKDARYFRERHFAQTLISTAGPREVSIG